MHNQFYFQAPCLHVWCVSGSRAAAPVRFACFWQYTTCAWGICGITCNAYLPFCRCLQPSCDTEENSQCSLVATKQLISPSLGVASCALQIRHLWCFYHQQHSAAEKLCIPTTTVQPDGQLCESPITCGISAVGHSAPTLFTASPASCNYMPLTAAG